MWLSIAIRGLLAMEKTVTVVCGFSVMSYPRYTNAGSGGDPAGSP